MQSGHPVQEHEISNEKSSFCETGGGSPSRPLPLSPSFLPFSMAVVDKLAKPAAAVKISSLCLLVPRNERRAALGRVMGGKMGKWAGEEKIAGARADRVMMDLELGADHVGRTQVR